MMRDLIFCEDDIHDPKIENRYKILYHPIFMYVVHQFSNIYINSIIFKISNLIFTKLFCYNVVLQLLILTAPKQVIIIWTKISSRLIWNTTKCIFAL